MRKFAPLATEAEKKGLHIYHLNIGQPDIATPEIYYQTLRNFSSPVLSYAPSNGLPEMLEAVQRYYASFGVPLEQNDILIGNGGSEALQMLLACILDSGDEIVIEQRKPEEVTDMWYKERMAPEGISVYNPAFDVTDNDLITGIITEYGIARAPYTESLKEIFRRKEEG